MKKMLSTLVFLVTLFISSNTTSQEYHSNPSLLNWIPATCCVTNDCCWEISESELKYHSSSNQFEIKSTGQLRDYDFSPDGKYYRCACDYDSKSKSWIKHQGANTRCLFIPQPST